MLVRRTQDPEYWRTFSPADDDVRYARDVIAESSRPMETAELARAIVYRRMHQERERIREMLDRGRFYNPAEAYEVGEELLFPALDFAAGVIVGKRAGYLPHHPPFQVISVQTGGAVREFASEYTEAHKLNQSVQRAADLGEGISPAAVFERFAEPVTGAVGSALAAAAESGFVQHEKRWYLRESMPDVHVGYLNLAEAVIEVAWESASGSGVQKPLTTDDILGQVGLQGASSPEVARFSMDLALARDERFVDVGDGNGHLWLLRRLVPEHAIGVPARLRHEPIAFSVEAIPTEALSLVWGVPDELSSMAAAATHLEERQTVDLVLPYPHWRAGTLPLTSGLASVLPQRESGLGVVTLMDPTSDERITAWVSYEHRYVSSLQGWYDAHQIPAGAFITVSRTNQAGVYTLGCKVKRRQQREFVRLVSVDGDKLAFEIRRQPMAVEFDETMVMLDETPQLTDGLWRRVTTSRRAISELLREVFAELAKLSPQGTVHFNTLYTAINVVRRCPPEPILAELSLDWRYVGVGSGYYAMDERVAV